MKLSISKEQILFFIIFFTLIIFFSQPVFAAAAQGGGLPYESWLEKVRDSITGPYAFTASILGIVGAGSVLIFGGELNSFFRTLVYVVLVLSLIISAPNFLSAITGHGAEIDYFYNHFYDLIDLFIHHK
jgi:Type IV secretory pathway, VirB2 components (pilins)